MSSADWDERLTSTFPDTLAQVRLLLRQLRRLRCASCLSRRCGCPGVLGCPHLPAQQLLLAAWLPPPRCPAPNIPVMLRLIFPQAANKTALTALGCYDVNKPHVPTQVALPMICLDDSTGARCLCTAWSGCLGWRVLVLRQLQGCVLCWLLGALLCTRTGMPACT